MPIHYAMIEPHVVRIVIDRPAAKNALDFPHFRDLAAAWRAYLADDGAWVAIVTGVPGCFMAGGDLKSCLPQFVELQEQIQSGAIDSIDGYRIQDGIDAVLRNVDMFKPVIAAIDGPCVAGGMELLGSVDIRVATPRATFGVLEPRRGLFAGGGTTVRLPRQLAYPAAMEFLLTAEALPAERALALGLLNEVVPVDELQATALRWAQRITANSPLAIRLTKESVRRGLATSEAEALDIEAALAARAFRSADASEGPRAFAEKRDPVWTGL